MQVEIDEARDATNIAVHGIPLATGAVILQTAVGEVEAGAEDGRVNAFGFAAGRLFACTYRQHGDTLHIISVRKASQREQQTWQS